jgi:hypothetical protein
LERKLASKEGGNAGESLSDLITRKQAEGSFVTDSAELCSQMAEIVGNRDVNTVCGVSYQEVQLSDNADTVGIINTDTREGPGKHWVSFAYFPNSETPTTVYYDSLGEAPTPAIARQIAPGQLIYWDGQQQPDSSDKCGFYALNFIRTLMDNWESRENVFDFYMTGLNFNETAGNEKKILGMA